MKLVLLSMLAVLSAITVSAQNRPPQNIQSEIRGLARELMDIVQSGELSLEEMRQVRNELRLVVDLANGTSQNSGAKLICTKYSNGLFYPSKTSDGSVVGSNSYLAGYASLDLCRETLPKGRETVSCFKQSNGTFYPTNSATGTVIGSNSYLAGHADSKTCQSSLPKRAAQLACYKQSNGMYYPSKAETGEIVGSNSYSAGNNDLATCLQIINQ